ncbi:YecA family protein [Bacillus paranthracis]|uniref:YecA family protein n=1 Tax=Bacillus paranthracis TaxID=2026186 RepID=UPI001F5BE851|nr:SEC-C metal-binding domain-containing protein [Bacillus paranthracis]
MDFNMLKNALKNGDAETASKFITDLYLEKPEGFRKSLLLSNSLPEPLEMNFSDEKFKTLIKSFCLAGVDLIKKDVDIEEYVKDFMQIQNAINVINKNSRSNLKRLEKSEFLTYSLSKQLQMFCIYLEDQSRLTNAVNIGATKYITGMESQVAKFSAENFNNIKVSAAANFEALIEIADTLFRFLYFKARKSIEKEENFYHESITPYGIANFKEILHLALQRNSHVGIWGAFKYRNWNLIKHKANEMDLYVFEPNSKEEYKKELIGANRYQYRNHLNAQKVHVRNLKENGESAQTISEVASNVRLENLFQLEKEEFLKPNKLFNNLVKAQLNSIDKTYYEAQHKGIKIEDFVKGIEYLYTIATIYRESVLKDFNQDDDKNYKYLAPIVEKVNFINQFKQLYDIESSIAEEIINYLTFSPDAILDVFSQPLIYVGKEKVVFCPALILQMNMARIIERLVTDWKIDVSDKGKEFEKNLRYILSFNPHIEVNTNKIEFMAYDGRDVEFDFIGKFQDHILLMEFKHVKIPFSDRENRNAMATIDYGIEQVNRRSNILQKDWDKIKEKCSFRLPDIPPDEDKIIKLVCTNIFDFSTIIRDDVEVIDSSSLLKFFMNPEIKGVSIGSDVEEVFVQSLWNGQYPLVEEFKEFLNCPAAIKPYVDCYKEVYKPIEKTEEEDFAMMFFDYSLIKDPYEIYISNGNKAALSKKVKTGRNEPCPCKSGKKYKKCCGV